jgi:seryl-tRNA synthetase
MRNWLRLIAITPATAQQSTLLAVQSTLSATQKTVNSLSNSMNTVIALMEQLMTQDATVLAAVTAIEADLTQAATVLTGIQADVNQLLAEVAAGGTPAISQTTLDALAASKAQADAFLATETADAAADVPPVTG